MIISVRRNKEAALNAINDFVNVTNDELDRKEYLVLFTKFLAGHLLIRVQDNDCYFIDMLEDLEKIDER